MIVNIFKIIPFLKKDYFIGLNKICLLKYVNYNRCKKSYSKNTRQQYIIYMSKLYNYLQQKLSTIYGFRICRDLPHVLCNSAKLELCNFLTYI